MNLTTDEPNHSPSGVVFRSSNQIPVKFASALIVGGGTVSQGIALNALLTTLPANSAIICADSGADSALQLALTPTLVIGDMDSIQAATLISLEQRGIEIIRKSPHKDETDLELALLMALERGATWLRIIGGIGNRLDQTIANLYLLTLPQLHETDTRLVDGHQTTWLLSPGEHSLIGHQGDTISLIPFDGDIVSITTHGLEYPLNHETLYFGPARGISNVINAPPARIAFESGRLLVVHTVGRA